MNLSGITKKIINKISFDTAELNSEKEKLLVNDQKRELLNKERFEIESEINKHNIIEEINNKMKCNVFLKP